MNRNAKRAVTLLILATMIISMFPVMGVSADMAPPELGIEEYEVHSGYDPDLDVMYGDTLWVTEGSSGEAASGAIIAVYWDYVGAWDEVDQEGYLNETEATSAGNYEVWLDVPEGTYGQHDVWVKNLDTGDYDHTAVWVVPKVKSSPGSGLEDDRVTVKSYGLKKDKKTATLFSDEYYFYDLEDASVDDESIGSGTELDGNLDSTPIVPGSVEIWANTYESGPSEYYVYDGGDGKLYWDEDEDGPDGDDPVAGDINYIDGEYEVEFPVSVHSAWVDYEYYTESDTDNQWILEDGPSSNDLGTYIDKHDIPIDSVGDLPDVMYFHVYDETGKRGQDDFKVGSVLEVEPEVFAVGDIITLRGRGFTPGANIDENVDVKMYGPGWDSWMEFKEDSPRKVDSDGEFRFDVIVPGANDEDDDFYIWVQDSAGCCEAESGDLEVTDEAEVTVEPDHGAQGRTAKVTGKHFQNVREYELAIYYRLAGETSVEWIEDIETNSRGEFEEEFTIPATDDGDYEIVVKDKNSPAYISADTEFRIGSILVLLSKDAAPSGIEIIMTGNGFTPDGTWNATFGDLVLYEEESVSSSGLLEEGTGLAKWYVPQVEPGTYTITVTDMDNMISVDVPFEVTKTTAVELNANDVPNEFNLTFEGWWWAETGGDIEMVLYNDTDYWNLDPITTVGGEGEGTGTDMDAFKWDDDANFTAWWEIFDDEQLDKGDYTINITDDEDFLVQVLLTIGDKVQSIVPRKSSFAIGEQVAFDIMHSFKLQNSAGNQGSYVKIFDPDGELYWRTDDFMDWEREGPYYWMPYAEQTSNGNEMWLLEDAPLGEWSFTWYEYDDDKLESGAFSVTESPGDVLSGQIEDVNSAIGDLQDEIQGVSDDMAGLQGDIADAVSAANAATSAANAAVDAVNAIAATAGDAAEAAQAASEAADEARKAAGGLTTLVYGAIGASLVAALAAIVSLMQISRRIAG